MTAFLIKPLLYCYILAAPVLAKLPAFHPLHVSTTDISYNAQDKHLEVICTIFTDDFEAALSKQYHIKIDLTKPEMHKAMDVTVRNYLNSNLHLKAGNVVTPLNYVGYEINREAVNVYLETDPVAQPKKIGADISLLHNLFDDQLNIVHMTVAGTRKSEKLDYPATRVEQVF